MASSCSFARTLSLAMTGHALVCCLSACRALPACIVGTFTHACHHPTRPSPLDCFQHAQHAVQQDSMTSVECQQAHAQALRANASMLYSIALCMLPMLMMSHTSDWRRLLTSAASAGADAR